VEESFFFWGGGGGEIQNFRILGGKKNFWVSFNLSGDFCRVPKKMRTIAVKKIVT